MTDSELKALRDDVNWSPKRTHDPGCPAIADDESDYAYLLDAGLCACGADLFNRMREAIPTLIRERDLAVAHDRQPYPTAWAYEQACRVRDETREKAEAMAKAVEALVRATDPFQGQEPSEGPRPVSEMVVDLAVARDAARLAVAAWRKG